MDSVRPLDTSRAVGSSTSSRTLLVHVVAAYFPAINQPWMDTYLSQLIIAGHQPLVLSANQKQEGFAPKVMSLAEPGRVRLLPGSRGGKATATLRLVVLNPRLAQAVFRAAFSLFSGEPTITARLKASARSLALAWPATRGKKPDVLHIHSFNTGVFIAAAVRARNVPLVITFHGLEPVGVQQVSNTRARMLFSLARLVIVNTQFAADQARALGCAPALLKVLPQGLPLEDFPFTPQPLPQHGEPLRILSVARFHRDKGQRYSLLAAARLKRRGIKFEWSFVGVGPELEALQQMTVKLGLADVVQFHIGVPIDRLRSMYGSANIFVLASVGGSGMSEHVETQGVVLQEAQASGCVTIASAVGGIPECIEDGVSGILVPDRSHRAIAMAIEHIAGDEVHFRNMQHEGRAQVELRFSAATVGAEMSRLLQSVVTA